VYGFARPKTGETFTAIQPRVNVDRMADALAALAAGDGTERAPAPTKASAQEFDRASPRPATSRQS
jgi:hypothetical protein